MTSPNFPPNIYLSPILVPTHTISLHHYHHPKVITLFLRCLSRVALCKYKQIRKDNLISSPFLQKMQHVLLFCTLSFV